MPYSVKFFFFFFFEVIEDMIQTLLMLEVLFKQDAIVEDLFCGTSSFLLSAITSSAWGYSLLKMIFSMILLE